MKATGPELIASCLSSPGVRQESEFYRKPLSALEEEKMSEGQKNLDI